MKTFGERLRASISDHGISEAEYARKIGISPQNLSHYIAGQRKPGVESLSAIAKELPNADVRWLIGSLAQPSKQSAALAVWYGSLPESNGKSNWTAILHNGDITSGITLEQSEYPDRVRYEADRARWLIGDLAERPFILDYDADKHSGYVPSAAQPVEQTRALTAAQIEDLQEAREILENMVRSVEIDGNYSTEATCTFLRQALLCLPAARPASGETE